MDFATHNGKAHPVNNKPKLSSSHLQESESNHVSRSKVDKLKKKSLLKPEHLERLYDDIIKKGSYLPITPHQKGLDGKPLQVVYHQDYHPDIVSSNGITPDNDPKVRSQGYLIKEQYGIPKLNKKMWYGISGIDGDENLNYIIAKKSDTWKPDERGHWQKEKDGSYWSGYHDDAIHLVRGDLISQDDLTKYYENSINRNRYESDNVNTIIHTRSPMRDSVFICKNCHNPKRDGGKNCKTCGY